MAAFGSMLLARKNIVIAEKYNVVRKIGGGSFGDIYLAINIYGGEVIHAWTIDFSSPRWDPKTTVVSRRSSISGFLIVKMAVGAFSLQYSMKWYLLLLTRVWFPICFVPFRMKSQWGHRIEFTSWIEFIQRSPLLGQAPWNLVNILLGRFLLLFRNLYTIEIRDVWLDYEMYNLSWIELCVKLHTVWLWTTSKNWRLQFELKTTCLLKPV